MKRTVSRVSLLVCALTMLVGSAYANEKCKECHGDIAAKHAASLHGKAGNNCETCHGNAAAHLASGDKKDIITFGKETKAEKQNAQCLKCHSKNQNLMFWANSKHSREEVSCVSCHGIHQKSSPKPSQPETCFTCHSEVRSEANMISHHPIIEGKIKCSDCHNPHGALGHGEIKAENTNQLCYKCHAEKRGPFVYEHPPVEENCLKCHGPHGTKALKLTNEKLPNLCENCHVMPSHPSTLYSPANSFNGTASKSGRFFGRSCVNCHQNLHGTNAPGGKRFVR